MIGRRAAVPLLFACLLSACGSSVPEQAPATNNAVEAIAPSPAPTPPPTATPPADALAQAAADYAAGEKPLVLAEGMEGQPARYFDVIDCNEEMRGAEPGEGPAHPDEVIARRVALLRRSLQLLGYSPAVIEEPLATYAAEAVHETDLESRQPDYQHLAAALEAKRAALQPDLPPIRAEGGCGAAETPILVRTRPAGGRVWLITKFAFALCRARHLDPFDRMACDRWREVGPDRPVQLSGNYVYQAQWPGGKSARGEQPIDPVMDEDDSDAPRIITIGQP